MTSSVFYVKHIILVGLMKTSRFVIRTVRHWVIYDWKMIHHHHQRYKEIYIGKKKKTSFITAF